MKSCHFGGNFGVFLFAKTCYFDGKSELFHRKNCRFDGMWRILIFFFQKFSFGQKKNLIFVFNKKLKIKILKKRKTVLK